MSLLPIAQAILICERSTAVLLYARSVEIPFFRDPDIPRNQRGQNGPNAVFTQCNPLSARRLRAVVPPVFNVAVDARSNSRTSSRNPPRQQTLLRCSQQSTAAERTNSEQHTNLVFDFAISPYSSRRTVPVGSTRRPSTNRLRLHWLPTLW